MTDPDPAPQQAVDRLQRAALDLESHGIEVQAARLYGQERVSAVLVLRGVDFVEGRLVVVDER